MKLLTICVSWQRPELCKKMIESFYKTKKIAELFIYICEDDPKLEEYKKVMKYFPKLDFEIGKHLYIAEVSNYVPTIRDSEYYQMVNDDHEFVGEGWDEEMIAGLDEHKGWRIAASYMPEELLGGQANNPTAEIFSKKLIKAMGFYNFPGFRQFGCDRYIMDLGEDLGGILPFTGKILHNCWHGINRMDEDDTARFIYSKAEQDNGNAVIGKWRTKREEIKAKIAKAKENER